MEDDNMKISVSIGVFLGALCVATGASAQDGDPVKGAQIFKQCAACHKIGPNAKNAVGPELNGVVGRPAGSVQGYSYSSAMRSSGLTWDEPTLKEFLHSPRQKVRGTKMTFAGLANDPDLNSIISYLKQFDASGTQKPAQ
jgi:cytochrome c